MELLGWLCSGVKMGAVYASLHLVKVSIALLSCLRRCDSPLLPNINMRRPHWLHLSISCLQCFWEVLSIWNTRGCIHSYIYTYIRTTLYVCTFANSYIQVIRTLHTYITYIHYIHTCMHTYILLVYLCHTYTCTDKRACLPKTLCINV